MTEAKPDILLYEDFSAGMENWWAEGGVRTWVEDGRLHVDADPEAEEKHAPGFATTVWCKQEISGDVKVEFDAHVISSSTDVNNINFFLLYSDPAGQPLYETRASRASGGYQFYHNINGYIFTFVSNIKEQRDLPPEERKARFRIRRCPGFNLLSEAYTYHSRQGVTYHIEIVKQGHQLSISVDGNLIVSAQDPDPLSQGLIGLRTFRTYLWWDNIKVTRP